MPKTVKVREETHLALMKMKLEGRRRSIDEVIRDMVRETTGLPVGKRVREDPAETITSY